MMNTRRVAITCLVTVIAAVLLAPSTLSAGGREVVEENRSVEDVEAAFRNLTWQGEWLGYQIGGHDFEGTPHPDGRQLELFPGDPLWHIQGLARSPRTGEPPVFYLTVSGDPGNRDSYPGLLVVRLNSRPWNGERLRSNRLAPDLETTATSPPEEDRVVKIIEDLESNHPSGIQMVGDILAVPTSHTYTDDAGNQESVPKIIFYDCRNPTDPVRLDYEMPLRRPSGDTHGAQAVAITRLPEPDGRFLLMTNGGENVYLHWSTKTSFFETDGSQADDVFFHFDRDSNEGQPDPENFVEIEKSALDAIADADGNTGYWPYKSPGDLLPHEVEGQRRFQSLSFVNQSDGRLFLIGSANTNAWTPQIITLIPYHGTDEMYLLEVNNPSCPHTSSSCTDTISLSGVAKATKRTMSPGKMVGKAEHRYYSWSFITLERWISKRWQANFNAGAGAYVSPSGELLYYGASHFADGLGDGDEWLRHDDFVEGDFGKMAEFGHREVSADGTCGVAVAREDHLGGPFTVPEASEGLPLMGEIYLVEPWVRLYQDYDEGLTVMMDWRDQQADDYQNFRKLDGALGECRKKRSPSSDYPFGLPDSFYGFNNCASSFRWCGPPGSTLSLYTGSDFEGDVYQPIADGTVQYESLGNTDFQDDISSVRIDWTPPVVDYAWSLEGQGSLLENPDPAYMQVYTPGRGSSTNTVTLNVLGEAYTAQIIVENVPPSIWAFTVSAPPQGFAEGHVIWAGGEWRDPGAPDVALAIGWGDGTSDQATSESLPTNTDPYGAPFQFTHVYADNGTYTVEICADDGEDTTCESREITVDNVAPTVSMIDQVIYEGDDLTVAFNDLGTLDTHTGTVDWDDGSPPLAAVASETPFGPPGSTEGLDGTVTFNWHELPPGVYAVTVCVADSDGGETCVALNVTIVHGFLRFCAYADRDYVALHQDATAACALVPAGIAGDTRPGGLGSRGAVRIKDRASVDSLLLSLEDRIDVDTDVQVMGMVTADDDIKIDQRSHIGADVASGQRVNVKRDAWIGGNVTAADSLTIDADAWVTGARTEYGDPPFIPPVTFMQFAFVPGTEDVTVEAGMNGSLSPGAYGDVKVRQGATLMLFGGDTAQSEYVFDKFEVDEEAVVLLDLTAGPVVIKVAGNLDFKDNVQVQTLPDPADARGVLFLVAGSKVDLKKEGAYVGTFLAPDAHIKVGEDAAVIGALYGQKVDIGQRVQLVGVPARNLFAALFEIE